ncbi:MAG: hypothetical protein U1D35_14455 [Paracoccaceae bacterium]|nr:hypothetical protein [Paracoccaceae bacterium]
MRFREIFAPMVLGLGVGACSSIMPTTLTQLAAVQPLEADPTAIAVAIVLPAGLEVAPGSARLTVEALRRDTGEAHKLDLVLEAHDLGASNLAVPAGANAQTYTIAPPDVGRMRALQGVVRAWKAEIPVPDTGGSFGLGLGGCGVGDGLADDAVGSAYIRVAKGGDYVPLIVDGSLRDLLGPEVFDAIAPCNGPS